MLSGTNPYCDYKKLSGITSNSVKGTEPTTTEYTVSNGEITNENAGSVSFMLKTITCGSTPINLAFAMMYSGLDKAKSTPVGSWLELKNQAGMDAVMRVSEKNEGGRKIITVDLRVKSLDLRVKNADGTISATYYEIYGDTMFVKRNLIATVEGTDFRTSVGVDELTAPDPKRMTTEYTYR